MSSQDAEKNGPAAAAQTPPSKPPKQAPARIIVREVEFVASAPTLSVLPAPVGPELAFLGRSNVGKSSLLNALFRRKAMVRTSRTPGRTRALNLFRVVVSQIRETEDGPHEDTFELGVCDLPGYGYAKVSKDERAKMGRMITTYLDKRDDLAANAQLFDIRHAPSAADREVAAGLRDHHAEHILVATKADKIAKTKRLNERKKIADGLRVKGSKISLFSSTDHIGIEDVWGRLLNAVRERA